MSLERIIKALVELGLKTSDAEIYVYITKKGPQTIVDLEQSLNYKTSKILSSLDILITRKLVTKNDDTFFSIPFEEALELLINQEKQEVQRKKFVLN